MYVRKIVLDEKAHLNELKEIYRGYIKSINNEIASLWDRTNPAVHSKSLDYIQELISKKEMERQGFYDIIASLDYAIECVDYVKMTRDLLNREPISREVWEKDGYDK